MELSDLIKNFILDEKMHVVFSFEGNKAPGLDGFLFSFFQRYWLLVEEDLLILLDNFYHDRLDIDRLNYVFIVPIPNKARKMSERDFSLSIC